MSIWRAPTCSTCMRVVCNMYDVQCFRTGTYIYAHLSVHVVPLFHFRSPHVQYTEMVDP